MTGWAVVTGSHYVAWYLVILAIGFHLRVISYEEPWFKSSFRMGVLFSERTEMATQIKTLARSTGVNFSDEFSTKSRSGTDEWSEL